jgi:outer membrane protein OmpA-like peptidoglycan-associated protein
MESLNGYEDDDGCPDLVPDEVEAIDGTIEGVTYDPGKTAIRAGGKKQIKKIADVLGKYPAVQIKLVGHTDDREASAPKTKPAAAPAPADKGDGGDAGGGGDAQQPPPENPEGGGTSPAVALALERAGAVKAMLVSFGVAESRIAIEGKGADEPVGENTSKRGRQANRRVVLVRIAPGK